MKFTSNILAAAVVVCASPAFALTLQGSYTADITFSGSNAIEQTSMTIAFDGTSYFSTSGGGPAGVREAQYNSAGVEQATFSPGLDFRSIFIGTGGDVLARQFADATIYRQTVPGTFVAQTTLVGGALDSQSSVVQNDDGNFVAMEGGTVSQWDSSGTYLGAFGLSGFVNNGYPSNRGVAVAGDYVLTYDGAQGLSVWDYMGSLLGTTTLVDAGTSFDSSFSFSYANDRVFILDNAGGTWRGYDVGLGQAAVVPLPAAGLLLLGALGAGAAVSRRRKTAA